MTSPAREDVSVGTSSLCDGCARWPFWHQSIGLFRVSTNLRMSEPYWYLDCPPDALVALRLVTNHDPSSVEFVSMTLHMCTGHHIRRGALRLLDTGKPTTPSFTRKGSQWLNLGGPNQYVVWWRASCCSKEQASSGPIRRQDADGRNHDSCRPSPVLSDRFLGCMCKNKTLE